MSRGPGFPFDVAQGGELVEPQPESAAVVVAVWRGLSQSALLFKADKAGPAVVVGRFGVEISPR